MDARKRILDAAADVFGERGFGGASTREIAARAGVTQPLVHYHFATKDALWRAVVDELFAQLRAGVDAHTRAVAGLDARTQLRVIVRHFVEFSAAHPQLHRIIMQECNEPTARMEWLVDTHVQSLYDGAVALASELQREGTLPRVAPVHLYYAITGLAPTIFVAAPECRRLSGVDPFAPDVVAAHADMVVALLLGPDPDHSSDREEDHRATVGAA